MAVKKSANPKANAEGKVQNKTDIAKRVERRALNTNVKVEFGVPLPERGHRSKYPFERLVFSGLSMLLEDCTAGNAGAVKSTGKRKFGMTLTSRPEGKGYRFYRKDGPTMVEYIDAHPEYLEEHPEVKPIYDNAKKVAEAA